MESVSDIPISMSFSKLNTYENCPKRFYYTYVAKDALPIVETEQMQRGTRIHSSLELYGRSGDEQYLTRESHKFKGIVSRINGGNGDKYYEYQMSITKDRNPCDWDSVSLWLRGIADVLVVDGANAVCLDYKTGKPKTDTTQLMIFALLTFCHFPEVESVASSFLWLANDTYTSVEYKRKWADSYWESLEQRINKVHKSVLNDDFPTRPTKLCNWCLAQKICPDAYEERRRR